jgi:hypothetical protein
MEITVGTDFEQPSQNGVFLPRDWGKLKTDAHLARGMGLQLCVRHPPVLSSLTCTEKRRLGALRIS